MKYIIDIEDEPIIANSFHQEVDGLWKAKGFNSLVFDKYGLDKLTPYTEPDVNVHGEKAWQLFRNICEMNGDECEEVFGTISCLRVLNEMTYQEAKAKYEAWKKQRDEIYAGDEVEAASGNKACVLYDNPSGSQMFVFKDNGEGAWWPKGAIHKTGRHFSELDVLLKKMQEE